MNDKSLRVLEFNKIKDKIKEYCSSGASKDLIDALVPYDNIYEVREHLEETKEAFKLLTKKGAPPFEGLYDVRDDIKRAEKGSSLMPEALIKIAQMLRCSRRFKEYVKHKPEEEEYRVIEDICEGIVPLKQIEDEIFFAIVSENEIADRASEKLYNIRRSLRDKNASVKDKVNSLIRTNSKYLQDNLFTMRGDRYVLPVRAENKAMVPGLVHDQSASGATLFIEPMSLVNLNNEIKELMLKEKAEVERILAELSAKIYNSCIAVKNNSDIVWELDFIFAKAKYASSLNCTCPSVNEDGIIDIVEARHPLIDPRNVVPTNIYLGREFTSLVITGPNTGGKTVTLKTVGLLQLMSLSGLLIPARENSTVSFFNEIYADIGDEQSIEQSLSTFSSHMKNIVNIINVADSKSLALFDELGAGTDPTEGAALAVSILENLRKRNTKLISTTHYSELKAYALRTSGVENASVEFDVETLKPTYRLLIGIPGKSNAFEISSRLGLPSYVINDAREYISTEDLKFEDLIQSLQEKSIKAEEDAREAEKIKLETAKIKEKYQEKLYSLQKSRENALIEAQREAKRLIKSAKEEADSILKDMREAEKLGFTTDMMQKLEANRKKLKDTLENIEDKMSKREEDTGERLNSVSLGQEVMLQSINQKVTVLTLPDEKGNLQVQAGIMKITANIKDLRPAKGQIKGNNKIIKRDLKLNMKRMSSSVDLRGMDSEEAIYTVDKYLDDAYMSGFGQITIIHGKGTGVLRKVINDMLRKNSHVKNYRAGDYGEGGTGVTIVELK